MRCHWVKQQGNEKYNPVYKRNLFQTGMIALRLTIRVQSLSTIEKVTRKSD